MAIAIRGAATATEWASSASPALTLPTGLTAGDLMLAFIGTPANHTLSSITGWNLVGSQAAGSDSTYTLLWRIADADDANNLIWTFTNLITGAQVGAGVVIAYSGTSTVDPIHKYTQASLAAATALAGPIFTTTHDGCMIVQFAGCDPSSSAYAGTADSDPAATERYDGKNAGVLATADSTYIYIQEYAQATAAALALDITGLTSDTYAYFQVALSTGSDGFASLDALTEFLSTPATVANEITGTDIRFEVDCALTNIALGACQTLLSKYSYAANNLMHWQFNVLYGYLNVRLFSGSSGGAIMDANSTVAIPGLSGARYKFRVNVDINDGAGGSTAAFYYSTNGTVWTQIGTTVTTAATMTINAVNNTLVQVGNTVEENATTGKFYRARAWSDMTGTTLVFNCDLNDYVSGSTWTAATSGETWTVNGTATITAPVAPTGGGTDDDATPSGVTTGAAARGIAVGKAGSNKAITGVFGTSNKTAPVASAGSNKVLTGVYATAAVTAPAAKAASTLVITIGKGVTAARGTSIPSAGARAPPEGIAASAACGDVASSGDGETSIDGVEATSAFGDVIATGGVSVGLEGFTSTSAVETPVATSASSVPLTGQACTSALGDVTIQVSADVPVTGRETVSGFETSVPSAGSSIAPEGRAGTSGNTAPIASAGSSTPLSTRLATGSVGSPTASGTVGLIGVSATAKIYPVMPGSGFNRVGSATRTTFTATVSPVLNFPTGVAAGDLLVAFIGSATTYTLSSTTGWNLIGKQNAAGTDSSYALLWRYHTSGSSWTFTNLFTASQTGAGVIVAWNKTNTGTTPIHKYAQAASAVGVTSLSGPSLTTVSTPNCLIVQFAGCDPSTSSYAGTPDSSPVAQEIYDSKDTGNNTYIFIQSYLLTNPDTIALDVTGLTADNYAYFQIAIMAPFPFVTGLPITTGYTPPVAKAGSSPAATTRLATGSVGAPRGGGGGKATTRLATGAVGTVVAIGGGDAHATIDASLIHGNAWPGALGIRAFGDIQCVAKSSLVDGETLTLNGGIGPVVFEFDVAGNGVTSGRVQVNVSTDTSNADVANRLVTAINNQVALLDITASTYGFGYIELWANHYGAGANITITETVANSGFTVSGMSGGWSNVSGAANTSISERHATASIGTVTPVGAADGYATVTGQYATAARQPFTATSDSKASLLGLQLTLSRGLLVTSGAAVHAISGVEATAGNGSVATGPLLVGMPVAASIGSINIWPILQGQYATASVGTPFITLRFSGVHATFWFGYPVASITGKQAEALPNGQSAVCEYGTVGHAGDANIPITGVEAGGLGKLCGVGVVAAIGTPIFTAPISGCSATCSIGTPVAVAGVFAILTGVSASTDLGDVVALGPGMTYVLGRSSTSGRGSVVGSAGSSVLLSGRASTGSVGSILIVESPWEVGAYVYVGIPTGADAQVAISGLGATLSRGAVGVTVIFHPLGLSVSSAVGIVGAAASVGIAITGRQAVGAVGSPAFGISSSVAIDGVEATSEIPAKGALKFVISSSVALTGVSATSAITGCGALSGTAVVLIGVASVATLGHILTAEHILGVYAIPAVGLLTFGPVVAGVQAVGSVGIPGISTQTTLVGVETEAGRGAVSASTLPTYGQGFADGQEVVASLGSLLLRADSFAAISGRGVTSSISAPTVSSTTGVIPAGLQLTLTRGPIAAGQVLAGVSATGSRGTIRPTVHIAGLALTTGLGTPLRSGDAIRSITGVYCTAARTAPRADVAFEVEGVTAAGYADNLPASGNARVTLNATNVQATAYIGSVIATGTILGEAAVLGKSAAASVGTVRGTAGSITTVTGRQVTAARGDIILGVGMTVALTGLYTTSAKPADLVATSDASVALTGRSATAILGPMSGLAGGSAFILINTGVEVTAACGDVISRCNVAPALTGLSVTAYPGSVLGEISDTAAPDGVEATGSVGTVTAIGWTAEDGFIAIAGRSVTASLGTLTYKYGQQAILTGLESTAAVGTASSEIIGITPIGSTYTEAFTTPATAFTSGNITVLAGRNTIMVVSIVVNSTGTLTDPCITAVKWGGSGGVALTRAGYVPNDHSRETGLWYLLSPTAQTSTLYVTTANSVACSVVVSVFMHVSQYANPFRSVNTATGYSKSAEVSVYAQPGDLLIDAFMGGSTQVVTCMQTLDGEVSNSTALASRVGQSHSGMS